MALSADRNTKSKDGVIPFNMSFKVYTGVTIYIGALVALNATGYLVPVTASTTLTIVGRAAEGCVAGAAASGTYSINVNPGVHKWVNSAVAACGQAHVGTEVYGEDDQTISQTSQTGTLSAAGVMLALDADGGVWVQSGTDLIGGADVTTTGTQTLTNKRIPMRTGTDITADVTVQVANGELFECIPGANTTVTLGTTDVAEGDRMVFNKPGTEAFTVAVGALYTIPASVAGRVEIEYLHAAWRLASAKVGTVVAPAGHVTQLTTTGATNVTLPTTGTLSTLAGAEALTNKTLTTPTVADLTNMGHNHTNAAGGAQLTDAALSAAVTASKGGTGQAGGYAVGDELYASAAGTISKLAIGTANQVQKVNAGATAPEWATLSGTADHIAVTPGVGTLALDVGAHVCQLADAQTLTNKRFVCKPYTVAFVGGADTMAMADGNYGWIDTVAQNSVLTIDGAGAVLGDIIEINRDDSDAFTVAVTDGVTTWITMTASKYAGVTLRFNGTRWIPVGVYQQA